jgi:FemAB-related protein (PEP-CTERM system-associated)
MSIVDLTPDYYEAWNNFIHVDPNGSFFHLAEWKDVMEKSFGFQTYYKMEMVGNKVKAILPLALVNRPIFGPALISSPLCVYGGGLGKFDALEKEAAHNARNLGVQYLELRGDTQEEQNMMVSDRFYTFCRELSEDHEENLKAIPRKQRAEVRKAIKQNLETTVNQDIELFYWLYSTSVRNLGTPVFSKKYLKTLIEIFGNAVEITTISCQGNPLTSVLSFKYKDQILPYYGGGLPSARDYSAYPYMYWKVMERAVNQGYRIYDFGRSMKGSGAYAFKKNFGFEPQVLPYHYYLVKAKEMPDMDPDNPRNKILTSAWKKLPLPIANIMGPVLYPVVV